ncbi:MAG: hypothetical protein A2X56_00405 [Nitrospirae bacterium GWC2_57_13]|nr:MAG: hypothetical protein A2X56_00405 [Nitrospirae bacterium GWC2_57_13]
MNDEPFAVLRELSSAIGLTLSPEQETNILLRSLSGAFRCDLASLHLLQERRLITAASFRQGRKEHTGKEGPLLQSPLLEEAAETGAPIAVCDASLKEHRSQFLLPLSQRGTLQGVLRLARHEAVPFGDREQQIIGMIVDKFSIALDRAQLFQEEEAKTQSLNRLTEQVIKAKADWQNTFDSISDLVCILDCQSRITRVNRAFSLRLNKRFEELIGVPCCEVILHSCPQQGSCAFNSVLSSRQPLLNEMDLELGDALFQTSLYPFVDKDGALQGAIRIFHDITAQKLLEEELVRSDKMAAVGKLAAEISHEINNPLDYISNYLYLLGDSLPPEFPQREYLKKIEAGIDNLAALTRDLLEFSRPQSDVLAPLNMHRVIDGSLDFSGSYLQEKQIQVVKRYACADPVVAGSERMLQQVLLNLIVNALDAMPGGGMVSVATSCDRGRFVLQFSDTGPGIAQAHLTKIFEPFFTTKKSSGKRGTGLGLTICYNIINYHKGEIHVSGGEGTGAAFTISLPLAQQG